MRAVQLVGTAETDTMAEAGVNFDPEDDVVLQNLNQNTRGEPLAPFLTRVEGGLELIAAEDTVSNSFFCPAS